VKANKGSPGIDGMTVKQLSGHLKEHWPAIREQRLNGTYTPQPVKRVELPKPDGGVRKLGSDGAGSVHPASGDAGAAAELGRKVL
jgi:RNA-directed DNA polymerase